MHTTFKSYKSHNCTGASRCAYSLSIFRKIRRWKNRMVFSIWIVFNFILEQFIWITWNVARVRLAYTKKNIKFHCNRFEKFHCSLSFSSLSIYLILSVGLFVIYICVSAHHTLNAAHLLFSCMFIYFYSLFQQSAINNQLRSLRFPLP